MKLKELKIAPRNQYCELSSDNPLIAAVKLKTEYTVVECVLSDDVMRKMLDLCAAEIARSAQERVNEFVAAVTTLEGDKAPALLGQQEQDT